MLGDTRDQKLVVSMLQNSLDTDASETTAVIDFLSSVESEAKVSVNRIKTGIHP